MSQPPPIPDRPSPAAPRHVISLDEPPLPPPLQPPLPPVYGNGRWPQPRPGIVTAIAIVSITVGSIGIIGGGVSSLYAAAFYMISQTAHTAHTPQWPVAPLPAFTSAVAEEGPVATEVDGVEADQRQLLIDGLAAVRPLTPARRTQLDALFAKCGQSAFAIGGGQAMSQAEVKRAVNVSGQLPASESGDGASAGADYFELATGRIEVSDDRALFAPARHSLETTRVARRLPGSTPAAHLDPPTTPVFTAPPLAGAQTAAGVPPTAGVASAAGVYVDGRVATMVTIEGVLSTLLSVYLLVIGILTLRQNMRAGRMHSIFIAIKIPLTVVCGLGWYIEIDEFMSSMANANGRPGLSGPAQIIAIMIALVLPLLYPIGLTLTLMTKPVRAYFDGRPESA